MKEFVFQTERVFRKRNRDGYFDRIEIGDYILSVQCGYDFGCYPNDIQGDIDDYSSYEFVVLDRRNEYVNIPKHKDFRELMSNLTFEKYLLSGNYEDNGVGTFASGDVVEYVYDYLLWLDSKSQKRPKQRSDFGSLGRMREKRRRRWLKERKSALDSVYSLMSNKKYEDFVKQLGRLASDKKVMALLSSGLVDGEKNDEKLTTKKYYIDVKRLVPTQNEIDVDKSLKFALQAKFPTTEAMLQGEVEIVAPVVILNDKYILDGHHRWSQAYTLNKNAKLSVISLYGDIEPQEMLKAIQIAIAREIGEVPVEEVQGVNLLTVNDSEIEDAVYSYISDKALDLMVKYGKIENPDKDEAVEYIIDNVNSMRRTSQPIKNASDRTWMPQTPYAKNWLDNTTDGSNNYKFPFVKESKITYDTQQVKGSAKLHKNNTHFVIHKATNSIVNAWDYRGYDHGELMDFKYDYFWVDVEDIVDGNIDKFKKSDFAIVTKKNLAKKGIDLNDYLVFQGQNYD
jgi:hypothetical protein